MSPIDIGRPIYRTLWSFAAIALAALIVAGWALQHRQHADRSAAAAWKAAGKSSSTAQTLAGSVDQLCRTRPGAVPWASCQLAAATVAKASAAPKRTGAAGVPPTAPSAVFSTTALFQFCAIAGGVPAVTGGAFVRCGPR